jgi:hypothetical protein
LITYPRLSQIRPLCFRYIFAAQPRHHPTAERDRQAPWDADAGRFENVYYATLNRDRNPYEQRTSGASPVVPMCTARTAVSLRNADRCLTSGMGDDHEVVAYGYEDGDPNSKLMIWDNNSPGEEVVLEFKTAYDAGDRDIHMGAETWRGFFLAAIAPVLPAFLQPGRLLSDWSDPAIFVVRGGGRFWIPFARTRATPRRSGTCRSATTSRGCGGAGR